MKTYLVTGGAGFIGSNFIHYMLNKYNDIQILNVDKLTYAGNIANLTAVEKDTRYCFIQEDICNESGVTAVFEQFDIDYVVNFAAESHVDRSIVDAGIFVKTNVNGTVNLLNIAKQAGIVKFLQVSTDEVYGSLSETGLFSENTPLDPHSPYSASKASADLMVKAYADTYNLPINITRCSNNYGPYQFPEKLIPLMINNVLNKKDLPVYGDGMQIRDWLYVDDHCKAIDKVINQGKPGEIYNIGGHNEKTNIDIVKTILNHMDGDVKVKHVEDRKGHDRRYAIDPSKITDALGWYPETAFDEGIQKTITWYLNNREWLDNVTSGAYKDYYEKMYEPARGL